jgi:hypothetical protein
MTDEENFIIREPYQPNDEEEKAIKELADKGLEPKNWNSKKKGILSFKEHLRDDVYEKQNRKCAYCRLHIAKACWPSHREHIVYKDDHPQWMFLPKNLCVSCYWCNKWKDTTEVLEDPLTETYPKTGDGFKIIHPFYDTYSEHIELVGDVLYRGRTDKGKFTIETCHLYRAELAEERVDMKMLAENKGNIIAELIGLTKLPDLYVDEKDELIKYVEKIVNQYEQVQNKVTPAT